MRGSSRGESLKHASLGASLTSFGVATHQYVYKQSFFNILESSGIQFTTTLINGYINLRIYNQCKKYLQRCFPSLSQKQIIYLSAIVSSCETFLVVYCLQEYLAESKKSFHIAIAMQLLTLVGLGGIYEKVLDKTVVHK